MSQGLTSRRLAVFRTLSIRAFYLDGIFSFLRRVILEVLSSDVSEEYTASTFTTEVYFTAVPL